MCANSTLCSLTEIRNTTQHSRATPQYKEKLWNIIRLLKFQQPCPLYTWYHFRAKYFERERKKIVWNVETQFSSRSPLSRLFLLPSFVAKWEWGIYAFKYRPEFLIFFCRGHNLVRCVFVIVITWTSGFFFCLQRTFWSTSSWGKISRK